MKKEMIFAILLGLSMGLVVTYGIYTARQTFLPSLGSSFLGPAPSPTPKTGSNTITLSVPEDESILATRDIKVSGTTTPNSEVIIFLNNKPVLGRADHTGSFTVPISLEVGGNVILVQTLDPEGNIAEEERTVVYTTTPLEQLPANAATSSATTPAPSSSASPKPSSTPAPRRATPRPTAAPVAP